MGLGLSFQLVASFRAPPRRRKLVLTQQVEPEKFSIRALFRFDQRVGRILIEVETPALSGHGAGLLPRPRPWPPGPKGQRGPRGRSRQACP
jgi:hypothetical protein